MTPSRTTPFQAPFNPSTLTSVPGLVSVVIKTLESDGVYNVLCYTENFEGDAMSAAAVVATKQTIQTDCCRSILFTTAQRNVSSDWARSSFSAPDFVFKVPRYNNADRNLPKTFPVCYNS